MNKNEYKGLGRRKSSIARVKLVPGTGKTFINNRTPEDYFPNALVIQDMQLPLTLTNNLKTFDIFVKVQGIEIDCNKVQVEKQLLFIFLIVEGIIKEVNWIQSENKYFPNFVINEGI